MGRRYDIGECVDCGNKNRVLHKEWGRASPPRCSACGGRLEPSETAKEEHVHKGTAAKILSRKLTKGGHVIA